MAERSLSERVDEWFKNGGEAQLAVAVAEGKAAVEHARRELTPDSETLRQPMTI